MTFNPGGGGGVASASDVALSNPVSDDALVYDGATQKWQNQTLDITPILILDQGDPVPPQTVAGTVIFYRQP